jgi:hypothetical protein
MLAQVVKGFPGIPAAKKLANADARLTNATVALHEAEIASAKASCPLIEARKALRMAQAEWESAKKEWDETQELHWTALCLECLWKGVLTMTAGVAKGIWASIRWLGKGMR